jgi:hypothetical protein
MSTPIVGIAGCYARAASSPALAALRSVMKFRRRMKVPIVLKKVFLG